MLKVIAIVILLIEAALYSVLVINDIISDIRDARDIRRMIEEFEMQQKSNAERDADEE